MEKCQGKGTGVWASKEVNCGKVNTWEELMEDKGHFSKVCLADLS